MKRYATRAVERRPRSRDPRAGQLGHRNVPSAESVRQFRSQSQSDHALLAVDDDGVDAVAAHQAGSCVGTPYRPWSGSRPTVGQHGQ